MGEDPKAPKPYESASAAYQAYAQYLPQILYTTRQNLMPNALAEAQAKEAAAPREQALNAALYQQYAPLYAQQQAEQYAKYAPMYAQANAATERDVLAGPGGQSVLLADQLTRQIDPEYYATRELQANKLQQLLGGMDPNELSESEMSNIERGLARSNTQRGVANLPLGQNTLRAGMLYGNALDQKRSNVANAINTATQFLSPSRSGVDVFGQATGRQGTQALGSWGTGQNVMGQNQNFGGQGGQSAYQQGQNIWNTMAGFQTQRADINANRRDVMDRVAQGFGMIL